MTKMTVFEAYNFTKKELEAAGVEDFVFEAKQIIKHITGFTNAQILSSYQSELSQFQQNNLTAIIHQRRVHYPLQYIFGGWDFYGRSFSVGAGVLIPRADTEILVEKCIEFLQSKTSPKVLDLCTGSGCIGITIAKEIPHSSVLMVDKYDKALSYAARNIEQNSAFNAEIIKGDVFEGVACDRKYDLIVSNPPYISESEMAEISPETRFEPENALYGGRDGLDFYRVIAEKYKATLNEGGMLAFEVGYTEAESVAQILQNNGYKNINIYNDLNGIQRVVTGGR